VSARVAAPSLSVGVQLVELPAVAVGIARIVAARSRPPSRTSLAAIRVDRLPERDVGGPGHAHDPDTAFVPFGTVERMHQVATLLDERPGSGAGDDLAAV